MVAGKGGSKSEPFLIWSWFFVMCEGKHEEQQKRRAKTCFFWLYGRCKYGRRCRYSHQRPDCRYGAECKYINGPTGCRYLHVEKPKVNFVQGGTESKGRHNARNRRRRESQKGLNAEAKVSLVRITELETQLETSLAGERNA